MAQIDEVSLKSQAPVSDRAVEVRVSNRGRDMGMDAKK